MNNFQDPIISNSTTQNSEENLTISSNDETIENNTQTPLQQNADVEETKAYGSRNADKFVVRLPKGMRQTIAQVAKNYHRSMNSEIVSRLELSLKTEQWLNGTLESAQSTEETTQTELTLQEFAFIEQIRKLSTERQQSLLNIIAGLNP